MRDTSIQGADLGVYRLLKIFACLSVVFVATLALAPARSHFTEWRAAQKKYNALATGAGEKPVDVALHQIWKPDSGVVDRCASCHVGMGKGEPIASDPLFRAHPPIPHDPADFGCTPCHGGQGRATREKAAHGDVEFWDSPMLAEPHVQAGCGFCHTGVGLPRREVVERGRALLERHDCKRCHRLDGAGRSEGEGAKGGDLSTIGLAGVPGDWHEKHSRRRQAAGVEEPWASSYGEIPPEEVAAISAFLSTRIGAPAYVEARLLVDALGCRGCHKINGVGGDEAPDLSDVGRKPKGERDFARVAGREKTAAAWLAGFLADPGQVVAGSTMPTHDLTPVEIDSLVLYAMSLRGDDLPAAMWSRDRMRTAKLGEREFATDGESLYGVFCSGCHGARGEGRRFGGQGIVFPAIGNPDFLAVAPDDLVRRAIASGRPGRKMPGWGAREGGLGPEEVDRVVGFIRSLEPDAPAFADVQAAPADPARGEAIYRADCASCHGARGEGGPVGTPLAAGDSKRTAEDLYEGIVNVKGMEAEGSRDGGTGTRMGRYRMYPASDLASLVGFLQGMPVIEGATRLGWMPAEGDADRGEALFARSCAGCHGPKGLGGEAPAIGSPELLAAAGDGYLSATIVRGREGTGMGGFGRPRVGFEMLDGEAVADVVRYLRSLAPRDEPATARGETGPSRG